MLSILIPTYNTTCVELVRKLHQQALTLEIPFEILVVDDGSIQAVVEINNQITAWKGCRLILLDQNIGPARIRNFLAAQAQYPYLLFLDSDTMPKSDTFLADYMKEAKPGTVTCGGFVYHRQAPSKKCALRYYYGIHTEEKTAEERNRHPHEQFIGMSFLADQAVFIQVHFDETMHFGYEDAYFGILLQQAHIPVRHIENPVYHVSMDSSEAYLAKIRRSVENLSQHMDKMKSHIRLLRWYGQLDKFKLVTLTSLLFSLSQRIIENNLTSPHPNLSLFAFYKLGYLCRLTSRK